jgi:hypothetical protein
MRGGSIRIRRAALTTLAFRDILPVNPLARSLAMLEGLVGQPFPVVLMVTITRLSADPQAMTMAIKAVFGSPSPGAPHRTGRIARASLPFQLSGGISSRHKPHANPSAPILD